jgi:predicted RNase H-like HicB family nuclease
MQNIAHVSIRKNPKSGNLHIEFGMPIILKKEGKTHIAYSPMLDLCSHGKTQQQAEKHFREAVELFFEEIILKGTADEVLRDLGWMKEGKKWQSPVVVKQVFSLSLTKNSALVNA